MTAANGLGAHIIKLLDGADFEGREELLFLSQAIIKQAREINMEIGEAVTDFSADVTRICEAIDRYSKAIGLDEVEG